MRFARYFDWRSDGTIVGTDRVRLQSRIAFLELGEMEGLFDDLSMMIGVSIDHMLIEAEKNVGKAFYASTPLRYLKYAPRKPALRPVWVAKAAVRGVRSDVAGLGGGIIKAESYDPYGSMVLRISNPVFVARTVGNSVGIYESIERVRGVDYEYRMDNGGLLLTMRHPTGDLPPEPLSETRLVLDSIVPGDGPVRYERCGRCGTPAEAPATLEWDLSKGVITNRLTGKRLSVGSVQSVKAMMRELEKELGEDVLKPLHECQREITRQQLERDSFERGDGFWDRFFYACALKGLGHPSSFEADGGSITVEITNPYETTLFAARVASGLEYLTGEISRVDWEMRGSDLSVFTVSARRGNAG